MKLLSIILFLDSALTKPDGETFIQKVIPNFWAFLVQLIAFIIMILAVIKLAYKPVSKFIEERKNYVEKNLTEAKTKNEEATKNLEETRSALASTQRESIQMIQDAKREAEKERDSILEATKQEIAMKHQKAQEDIEIEKQKAMKDLHDEVVDIALEATKSVLGREVTNADNKQMVDSFVTDLMSKEE